MRRCEREEGAFARESRPSLRGDARSRARKGVAVVILLAFLVSGYGCSSMRSDYRLNGVPLKQYADSGEIKTDAGPEAPKSWWGKYWPWVVAGAVVAVGGAAVLIDRNSRGGISGASSGTATRRVAAPAIGP